MARANRRIAASLLADLYLQLRRMEEAGLPARQAFALLYNSNPRSRNLIRQIQQNLQAGMSVSESMIASGLFPAADKAMLAAGEHSGNLATVYRRLSDNYRSKAERLRQLKGKLYLPVFMLLIAMLVRPLPELIAQNITFLDYVMAGFGQFTAWIGILYCAFLLPFWLTEGCLAFLRIGHLIHWLQYKLPWFSAWMNERQCHEFFRNLGLLLDAGVAMSEAMPDAIESINNPLLRKQFQPLQSAIFKGRGFAESLSGIAVIESRAVQLLRSAEYSGKLAETLLHYSKLKGEDIKLKEDIVAEWIPRVFYLTVACWIAVSMVGGFQITSIPF